jgi:hypothetical protein
MNFIQSMLQTVEVGKGQFLVRIIPLITALIVIGAAADLSVYHGLSDPQSMDNAQLARQIVRGKGFTTEFLRPHAVAQLRDYAMTQSLRTGKPGDLFPANQYPIGTPRVIPDTYNAPAYPYLLAAWFYLIHPEFDQTPAGMNATRLYSGDRWIPLLNQVFLLLTAVLVFALGRRLFDGRVAWMSLIAFLATELVWEYSITALSTTLLMFLVTASLLCVLEIFCIGEACYDNDEVSFAPAWFWALGAGVLIGLVCLTRLHLIILLVPIFLLLMLMPRASFMLLPVMLLVVAAFVGPWFWHEDTVSGNPLGSNAPLLLYGESDYKGNEIYCTTSIPNYERLLRDATRKETYGFRYHFEHAWTRLFHWLLVACTVALIAANSLGVPDPDAMGPWNIVIVLFPCMLVIGGAIFFILLDRLNLQLWLLNNLIVTVTLVITALPLTIALTVGNDNPFPFAFPPYWPPAIKYYGQTANPDEWVTSDMPWATAWYADRASLWLPDSITDFQNLHDNVCPTGIIVLTRISLESPLSTFATGEYKNWLTFIIGLPAPDSFPLPVHSTTPPGGPDISVWSDRPRWAQ